MHIKPFCILIYFPHQTLESEEVDLNAGLHGNWTLDNAKARLNQFFQKEKVQTDYKYNQVGPDHNRFESHKKRKKINTSSVTQNAY